MSAKAAQNGQADGGQGQAPEPQGVAVASAKILEYFDKWLAGERDHGMTEKAIKAKLDIGVADFRKRLREVAKSGAIVIKMPRNDKLERALEGKWPKVKYYVLDAEDLFDEGAAGVFFEELRDALNERHNERRSDDPFRLGVVSGRTTGNMVEEIVRTPRKWSSLIPMEKLPAEISTYALNVSQTDGYTRLSGNANVLAYELARRISKEVRETSDNVRRTVQAYGLSAALLQTKDEVRRNDCNPETRKVLRHTDPQKLAESLKVQNETANENLPNDSQLDIVITGVGSVSDSLFTEYSRANGLDMQSLQNEGVVGDIAYCPVTRLGELRTLRNKDGKEVEFYRAVSLEVLKQMSTEATKKVIVVARSGQQSKIHPIHAAIKARLCNVLITDVKTAEDLVLAFA